MVQVMELRPFRTDDAEAVWRLHNTALEAADVHGGHGPWEDDLQEIGAAYQDPGGEFLLGFLDGTLVAMGGLRPRSPEEGEIRRMRVHPDFQRRGFARQLLEDLEERARALGFGRLALDTTVEQLAAQRLYESAGFRQVGRRAQGRFVFIDYAKSL